MRGLLSLGGGKQTCAVAVVPLPVPKRRPPAAADAAAIVVPACYALLVFAKQQICDSSTMALFARERGPANAVQKVSVLPPMARHLSGHMTSLGLQ